MIGRAVHIFASNPGELERAGTHMRAHDERGKGRLPIISPASGWSLCCSCFENK